MGEGRAIGVNCLKYEVSGNEGKVQRVTETDCCVISRKGFLYAS